MLDLKEIQLEGCVIKARVEPWAEEDRSFDIEVDVKNRKVIKTSLDNDSTERFMYAGNALYKLCKMYDISQKK